MATMTNKKNFGFVCSAVEGRSQASQYENRRMPNNHILAPVGVQNPT